MSFNSDGMDRLDEYRVELVALRPEIFIDVLRSKSVLTQNDSQQILNDARHPTMASKMGEMLDILKSKGPRGYKMFIEVLGSENAALYKKITGKDAPIVPPRDIHRECRCGNIFNLEQLTEALRRKSQLEIELNKQKSTNSKLLNERRSTNEKLRVLWEQYNIQMDKNKDRDRLEAERNDMMEQLTHVTAKALTYKEDLEVVKRSLHKLRQEQLMDRQDLAKAHKGLRQQRQRSIQIENTKLRLQEELQETVDQLHQEIKKADKKPHKRISQPVPIKFAQADPACEVTSELINLQTDIEILTQDREQALAKADECAERAYSVTKELHQTSERLEMIEKENEDLLDALRMKKDEVEMQKSFVVLAEEGRDQAIAERDQALEEKKVQTEKCALLMLQRDKLFDDQRILRSKLESLLKENSTLCEQLIKYKKKCRIRSGPDNKSFESSSGDDMAKNSYDLVPGEGSENSPMTQGASESSDSTNKRDSTATSSSSQRTSIGDPHARDSDSDDQSFHQLPFRERARPVRSMAGGESPQIEGKRDIFSDFLHASERVPEEGRGPSGSVFQRSEFTDSTKVHVNGESIKKRQRDLLLGSYSINREPHRAPRPRKKKDKKASGMKRLSKSFNDLSNLTFDDADASMDLELATREHGSRIDRSRSLVKWFNLQKINQRKQAELAAIRGIQSHSYVEYY